MKNKNITYTFVVLAYEESKYLDECIKSVLNQTLKTNVIIATSTPNEYIKKIAKKYNLNIISNKETKGIGFDFDFALNSANTDLVTIAHQDDIYEENYAEEMIKNYQNDTIILFPNYYEIKGKEKVYKNLNLNIKKILLQPLKIRKIAGFKIIKRHVLRFGNAIGCPSVTFVKKNCPKELFASDLKCDVDWLAWEKLSRRKGKFIYINKYLMGHRIHEESTTTAIIQNNIRTKEDLIIFEKFWPHWFAKIINKFYSNSEKNNKD